MERQLSPEQSDGTVTAKAPPPVVVDRALDEPTRRTAPHPGRSLLILRNDRVPSAAFYVVLGLLIVAALSRSPYVFLHGRFWAEEGALHFRQMVVEPFPNDLLYIQNRTGYLNFVTNLSTWLADQVPLRHAPLVTAWLSLGVVMALAWVALTWPSELLPTAAARIAAATFLVVGTLATPDVWANSINLPTYLGLLTLLLVFIETRRIGRARFALGAAMLSIASISGIYSTVFATLYLFRAYQERTFRRTLYAGIITMGACIQFAIIMKNRASGDIAGTKMKFPGWAEFAKESAGRHVAAFLVGRGRVAARVAFASNTRLIVLAVFALAVCAFLAVLLAYVPNRRVPLMLGAAFVLTELIVTYGSHNGGGRYSVVPIGILTLALVHGAATARGLVLPLGATVLCGVVLLSGLSAFWTYDSTRLRCIGCPSWKDEVRDWEAGTSEELEIWPYPGWVVRLPPRTDKLREQLSAPGGENARPAGRVSAVEQDSVTIVGADGKTATVETAGASVARTEEGTAADITPGARVMVRPGTDGKEILVLPAGSRFGQNVTAVDGGSLTIVNNKGTTVTVDATGNSVVYRTIDARASAITKGATIFITGTRAADGTVEASEILVIPQNSAFEISPAGAGN